MEETIRPFLWPNEKMDERSSVRFQVVVGIEYGEFSSSEKPHGFSPEKR